MAAVFFNKVLAIYRLHIKYIQALLGHVDPKSTEIYIHVSNKRLLGIRSPYDLHKGGEA